MRLLVISQMFPCKRHPTSGIFFANLLKELRPMIEDLIVISPRPYIPEIMRKMRQRWNRWYIDSMTEMVHEIEIMRPHVITLPGTSTLGLNAIIWEYALFQYVERVVKAKRINAILGHNILPDGITAVRLARRFKLPVVTWCIGTDINDFANSSYLNYYLTRQSLGESKLVLTTSETLKAEVDKMADKATRVETFYRGIDIENFLNLPSRESLIRSLGLNPKSRHLIYVGRLIHDKGIFELAEAFNILAKRFSDVELLLIGEEIEKEPLVNIFRNYRILDRVHFRGLVSHKEVAYYMKVAELLLFPSWAEGLPNAVMEAMAIGLPVVATNVGGIPEILIDRVTGLLVPPKSVSELAKAATVMMEDNKLRTDCVYNARQLIQKKYDVKNNVMKFYHLMNNLVVNRGCL